MNEEYILIQKWINTLDEELEDVRELKMDTISTPVYIKETIKYIAEITGHSNKYIFTKIFDFALNHVIVEGYDSRPLKAQMNKSSNPVINAIRRKIYKEYLTDKMQNRLRDMQVENEINYERYIKRQKENQVNEETDE